LIALEQGATADARAAFVLANRLCAQNPEGPIPFAGSPIVGGYLSKIRRYFPPENEVLSAPTSSER
jgi:hypothetical protein